MQIPDMDTHATAELKVIVVDDHRIVRAAVAALISTMDGVRVMAEARDGRELLQLLRSVAPDVAIVDLKMPGLGGAALIRQVRELHPEVPLLAMSMDDSVPTVKRAIESGACGFIGKDASAIELEMALRNIVVSGVHLSAGVAQRLLMPVEASAREDLTPRQIEILTLLASGQSSKEIAFELGLSAKTVDVHRARISHRLGLGDVPSLTRYALRKGLVRD